MPSHADLASYLTTSRPRVMDRWRERVRRESHHAARRLTLTQDQLDDHLPSLIEKLADALRVHATPAVEPEGAAHGRQRRMLGYTIPEILWEFRLFRQVLMDAVREHSVTRGEAMSEQEIDAARECILDVIDRSVTASAERYVAETEAERNAAAQALQDRTRQLEERSAALEEADKQKNHFLAMLSHELRNPIAPIVTAAHLLKQAQLPPRFERAREIIARQARYQARLLDDLLEVNRIILGKVELHKQPVDVRDAVRQAAESCAAAIEAKQIDFELSVPHESIVVDADPTRLVQVVTNILTNAVKFTPHRGCVSLSVVAQDEQTAIRVRDNGIGIEPALIPRMFEMFAQADTSLDRTSGGLGIGLALAKYLVEAHEGSIEAHSQGLGEGALFVIRLPVLARAHVPTLASVPPSKRIGVVEDNADARALLADVLEVMGFTVLTAEDGDKAVELAAQERLDAYIIDLGLPGMDGFEVARRIRQLSPPDRALLIALSGYGSPEDKKRAADAGFDHHLTKPADMDILENLLRKTA
jgi:signal transduction histidine kinase/CheY-like chemotaxis protein